MPDNKQWAVGLNLPDIAPIKRFATHDEAAAYIETLENYESGRFYLDGPNED